MVDVLKQLIDLGVLVADGFDVVLLLLEVLVLFVKDFFLDELVLLFDGFLSVGAMEED